MTLPLHRWVLQVTHEISEARCAELMGSGPRREQPWSTSKANLVGVVGPACHYCQAPWSPEASQQPCPRRTRVGAPTRRAQRAMRRADRGAPRVEDDLLADLLAMVRTRG
jgi:hypothetical protein